MENVQKKDLLNGLQDKDDMKACKLTGTIKTVSETSDEYYPLFDDFLELLSSEKSFVRTRGFILCCAQAKWDDNSKLKKSFPKLLILLHDPKPTVVRQCLIALHEVALIRPELHEDIRKELSTIDLTNYKETMSPLIKKDIASLLGVLN